MAAVVAVVQVLEDLAVLVVVETALLGEQMAALER